MTPIDPTRPNTARIYDYWLGGKDNYQADREAAESIARRRPDVARLAVENKEFLARAVGYVAASGVGQFLDVGSGLPTSPPQTLEAAPRWAATHEAARQVIPDALVAYVDNDPVAVMHSQALLANGSDRVVAVEGDMSDPGAILADPLVLGAGLRLSEPAGVVLGCVLHFLDHATARRSVAAFARSLAPGSYLVISVGYDSQPPSRDFTDAYNAQQGPRIYRQAREDVTALFDGLAVAPPGIVDVAGWRAGSPSGDAGVPERVAMILGGVGRTGAPA